MAINFLTTTNTLPEIQINDTGNNPRLELQESGIVSGGISTTGGALVLEASSGIERARIDSVGRLMINTTTPFGDAAVTAVGISGTNVAGVFKSTDNQAWISVQDDDSGTYGALFGTDSNLGLDIILADKNVNRRLVIDTSGKVGIGTDSPGMMLHIKGGDEATMKLESTSGEPAIFWAPGGTGLKWENRASASRWQLYQYDQSEWVFNIYDAKVGIGTVSPTEKLQVNSGDILINNSTISSLKSGGSLYIDLNTFGSYSGRNFRISDNGTSLVNVKQTGEFGIGTTNPSYKLDVDGSTARIGSSSQQTTTLYLTATNTSGSPATATEIVMQGYEGRAIGTFYKDVTYSGEEWFSGVPYNASFNNYQIGYDYSGSQAEYTANAIITAYHNKAVYFNAYGSGSYTGTAATYLAVTSSGQIIETGSGGVLPGGPYLPLAGGTMTGDILFNDSVKARFGTGLDAYIQHDGTNTEIINATGNLNIKSTATDGDISFYADNGSGGIDIYFYMDGSGNRNVSNKNFRIIDGKLLTLGSSDDVQFFHNGTDTFIDNYTGNFTIRQRQDDGDLSFESDNGSGGTAQYLRLDGGTTSLVASKDLLMAIDGNGGKIKFGASQDLQIYHEGTDSIIQNYTGSIYIDNNADDKDIVFRSDNGAGGLATYLFLDGSKADGTGNLYTNFPDKSHLTFGDKPNGDLQIYHDGSNSYIKEQGTGVLYIQGSGNVQIEGINGENMIICNENGSVQLHYDNVQKFQTTSAGVNITGQATASEFYVVNNNFGLDTDSNYLQIRGYDGYKFYNTQASEVHLTIDSSGNVDFVAQLTIPEQIYHTGDANTYFGFNSNDTWRVVTGGSQRLDINNSGVRIGNNARVSTILDEDNMVSNSATALATQQSIKAYVDNSITGSTTYRGTWDPDVSLNSGYGNPNLNTVTKQDGYYYICSDNGSATPNGSGTEPNSWHTGDWVVYNSDLGSSGEWQKIDNTSVLSGTGTGQKVAKWDGSGTSETLADGPITFSSNNSTFAGTVAAEDEIHLTDNSTVRAKLLLNASDRDNVELRAESLGSTMKFFTVGTEALELDASQNANFAGELIIPEYLKHAGDADTYFGFSANNQVLFHVGGGDRLIINSAGNVGIGTTSPSVKFEVNGGSDAIAKITGTNTAARLDYATNSHHRFWQIIESDGRFRFYDQTNTAERLTITSSGNVGIATSNPGTNLQVNGSSNTATSIGISNTSTGASRLYMDASNGDFSGSDYMWIGQNNDKSGEIFMTQSSGSFHIKTQPGGTATNQFTVTQAGNIGIGTTSPTEKLEVAGDIKLSGNGTSNDSYAINFTNGACAIARDANDLELHAYDNMVFGVSNTSYPTSTERMRITSGGLVGIGTNSPTYDLSVAGAISGAGFVTYTKNYGSLNTTGNAVAGITTGSNGASCGFTFTCFGGTGKYQKIVYSCYNDSGTWRAKKVIDEGTNDLDVTASSDNVTITFTFKARSSSQSYTPRVKVEADGQSINSTYA